LTGRLKRPDLRLLAFLGGFLLRTTNGGFLPSHRKLRGSESQLVLQALLLRSQSLLFQEQLLLRCNKSLAICGNLGDSSVALAALLTERC